MFGYTSAQFKINLIRTFNYILVLLAYLFNALSPVVLFVLVLGCFILLPISLNYIVAIMVSAFFWLGCIAMLRYGLKKQKWPSLKYADKILEDSNDLFDRPIQLYKDHIVNSVHYNDEVWDKYKKSIPERLAHIRFPKLFYLSGEKDPYGLRVIPILLFVILFFSFESANSIERLKSLALPQVEHENFLKVGRISPVSIQIVAPEYTRQPIQAIKGAGRLRTTVDIAENSKVRFSVQSKWFTPKLFISGKEISLSENNDEGQAVYTYEHIVAYSPENSTENKFRIKAGLFPLFSMTYNVIKDQPPKLTIAEEFDITRDGTINFKADIEDDYGSENLEVFMDLPVDFEGELPLGQAYKETRSFIYSSGAHEDIKLALNLTKHTYAGFKANLSFNITDGAGQLSNTVTIPITLPERPFDDETAKRLIALRKFIITEKLTYPGYIYDTLSEISKKRTSYQDDKVAKLALSIARERILRSTNIDTLYDLIDILWRVALRLDKGELLQSQQDLQAAINALNKVLNDPNASQDEKLKAMRDLQNALMAYFQEAQKEAIRQMQDSDMAVMPRAQMPSPNSNALRDFLSQLEDMALNDPDKAKELLSDLENALNDLNNQMQAELPQDIKQMMQFMQNMDKIIEAQRNLLDKSRMHQDYLDYVDRNRSSKSGQTLAGKEEPRAQKIEDLDSFFKSFNMPTPDIHNNQGKPNEEENNGDKKASTLPKPTMDIILEAGTQRQIQDELNKMTSQMPIVPDELEQADKHMGNSATFLEYERLQKSIEEQEKILEALDQKREQMQQAFEQRLKQYAQQSGLRFSFDPLGRSQNDNGLTRSLRSQEYDLPEKGQDRYIDQILRELRERASDLERPKIEREYYKRLLHQW